jgi:uncharacterized protein YqhQ
MPQPANPTFGGQALIEGVLIRGQRAAAIAIRQPDGRIVTRTEPIEGSIAAALRGLPGLRGIATLYETFTVGARALYYSARVSAGEAERPMTRREAGASAATVAVAAAIFIAAPLLASAGVRGLAAGAVGAALTEGFVRMAMIGAYIGLVSQLPEVRRVFAYHGAEHRAIHAYEHGAPLTVEGVRGYANAHPRCGTAFLFTVGALSFATFAALPHEPFVKQFAERLVLLPLIAALAYEIIRASQAYEGHWLARAAQQPNLWLQKLTTRDPDDGQIEVALAALQAAIEAESRAHLSDAPFAAVPVTADDG